MKTFILANISDILSTVFGLAAGGVEANPVIRLVMETTSVPEALLVKLAIAAGIGMLINRWNPRLLNIPALAFTLVAISNSMVILGYA